MSSGILSSFADASSSLMGVAVLLRFSASDRRNCLAEDSEPMRSRMADRDGTSLYPLIYASILGALDMLSATGRFGADGDPKGSDVLHNPPSFRFSIPSAREALTRSLSKEARVGKPIDDEED